MIGKSGEREPVNGDGPFRKTLAAVRIATSVFFLFFGEYKVAGPAFAHGLFQGWLQGFINGEAVGWYGRFLSAVVLPHAVVLGYVVGIVELAIGFSLLLGLWVRPLSIVGILYMINLTLATWFGPGHGADWWKYLGNNLDHLPLLLLFVVFYAGRAGETWGLDGRKSRLYDRAAAR